MKTSSMGNLLAERLSVATDGYRNSRPEGWESACKKFVNGLVPELELEPFCTKLANIGEKIKGSIQNLALGNLINDLSLDDIDKI